MALPDPTTNEPALEDAAFVAAVEQGKVSLDAGKAVPYDQVRRWLLSWGSETELPPPECP